MLLTLIVLVENFSARYEVKTRKGKNPVQTPKSIEGKCYTTGGKCGTIDGSGYRGNDHGPDLDAVENVGSLFAGTDVGPRGIADDGILYVGGLGANSYASCHVYHDVNGDFAHSHWMYRKMPSKQQQVWLEKRCET